VENNVDGPLGPAPVRGDAAGPRLSGQRAAIRLGQDQRRTAVVSGPERMSRYVRPDEMHTTFNFDYLKAGWNAPRLREVIDNTLQALAPVGAPATWVLSSHDETRHVTRFGRADTGAAVMGFDSLGADDRGTDLALGTRRARGRAAHPGASGRCLHLPR